MADKKIAAPPARKPLADHLKSTALGALGVAAAIDLVIAALVTSRATAHALTPGALVAIVTGAAMTLGVLVSWPNALYTGARDVLTEAAVLTCEPGCRSERRDDPWAPRSLWRSTGVMAVALGLWALAAAGLVAVALNGKHARLVVVWAALLGVSGLSATFVEIVARHRGAHAARAFLAQPESVAVVPLRRRAWRQLALPVAVTQFAVNAGFAWALFHDYKTGDAFAPHALTKTVALADALVVVVVVGVIFSTIAMGWGMVDALLGRVEPEEPAVQTFSAKSPIGVQGVVYIGLAGLVLGKLAGLFLPALPTLLEVCVVRGAYAAILVFLTMGVSYVRGALNTRAEQSAVTEAASAAVEVTA